jgi:hypothetical protein
MESLVRADSGCAKRDLPKVRRRTRKPTKLAVFGLLF